MVALFTWSSYTWMYQFINRYLLVRLESTYVCVFDPISWIWIVLNFEQLCIIHVQKMGSNKTNVRFYNSPNVFFFRWSIQSSFIDIIFSNTYFVVSLFLRSKNNTWSTQHTAIFELILSKRVFFFVTLLFLHLLLKHLNNIYHSSDDDKANQQHDKNLSLYFSKSFKFKFNSKCI